MPGPSARSVELRLIEGGKPTDPQMNRPVAPQTGYPAPPPWFQPEAVTCYTETARRLKELDVSSEVDTDLLISYVMAIMIVRECEKAFSKVGVARSKKFRIWESTTRRVADMQKQLGLTPAARSGMRIKPNEAPPSQDLFAS